MTGLFGSIILPIGHSPEGGLPSTTSASMQQAVCISVRKTMLSPSPSKVPLTEEALVPHCVPSNATHCLFSGARPNPPPLLGF